MKKEAGYNNLKHKDVRCEELADHYESICSRCGGLMVVTYCTDLHDDTGRITIEARSCIQCGDLIDQDILAHRFALSRNNS